MYMVIDKRVLNIPILCLKHSLNDHIKEKYSIQKRSARQSKNQKKIN